MEACGSLGFACGEPEHANYGVPVVPSVDMVGNSVCAPLLRSLAHVSVCAQERLCNEYTSKYRKMATETLRQKL